MELLSFAEKHNLIVRKNKGITDEESFDYDFIKVVDALKSTKEKEFSATPKRIVRAERRKPRARCTEEVKRVDQLLGRLKSTGCFACGYTRCPAALEFHHRDKTEKLFPISIARARSEVEVMAELEKCTLLCSNCHREVHAGVLVI
jgi:hypothetical protein